MQSDVQITDVRLRLEPGTGKVPIQPLVESLSIEISQAAFAKIVQQGVLAFAGRLPVEVDLSSARLVTGGAEIVARVKRSILKADLRARLAFSVVGDSVRVRIAELDAPAWVPTQFVLDHGMNYATARAGFSRVPGDERAVDLNPEEILTSTGVPVRLAKPGTWTLEPTGESMRVAFSSAS